LTELVIRGRAVVVLIAVLGVALGLIGGIASEIAWTATGATVRQRLVGCLSVAASLGLYVVLGLTVFTDDDFAWFTGAFWVAAPIGYIVGQFAAAEFDSN
jgi:hypothetical protein